MVVNRCKTMGGRAGGGARGGSGNNPYKSVFDAAYNSQIKAIQGAIADATSNSKQAKSAAAYLKNEVLEDADQSVVAAAKKMMGQKSYYLLDNETNAMRKGGYAAAAIKMKPAIQKVLKSIYNV